MDSFDVLGLCVFVRDFCNFLMFDAVAWIAEVDCLFSASCFILLWH